MTTIECILYGVFAAAACIVTYFIGHHMGIKEGVDIGTTGSIDYFCKFLNSNDGKGFMRHYIFAHEFPYLVKTIGTEEAVEKGLRIAEDYESLIVDTAAKETISEAEDLLNDLGKEN